MLRRASPFTAVALVAETVTTLSNGLSAQVGSESADTSIVTVAPTGSVSIDTASGLAPSTDQVTPGTSADTVTEGFDSQPGSAMPETSMPRPRNGPSLWTVIVKSTGVA